MGICSKCGGIVISMTHAVYRTDGGSSGTYNCQDCGKTKQWNIPGYVKEQIIDMDDK